MGTLASYVTYPICIALLGAYQAFARYYRFRRRVRGTQPYLKVRSVWLVGFPV